MSDVQQLQCAHVVVPSGVLENATVTVDGSKIISISADSASGSATTDATRIDGWLIPGFVDTHVHGGGGADFATLDPEQARTAALFHRRNGTTTGFASLVTTGIHNLCAQIETLVPLVDEGEFAGIHLEGPFLSSAKCGAHDPGLLRAPQGHLLDAVLDSGAGHISMITLAPELTGGLSAIERLRGQGVVAAVGHTDADESIIAQAVDAGASVATHLFNAMRPIHHRHPGPVPLLLSDPRVVVELICDGTHLHRDVIAMAIAAAGPERVALITDAMVAAGVSDGHYSLGTLDVAVSDGVARLVDADGNPGSIAGSTLTMAAAFGYLVSEVGISIPDAAVMASTTPARAHGLSEVGTIAVGQQADLLVVDDQGTLLRVMRRGEWLEDE